MESPYDVYVREHVDELKRDYLVLWRRYCAAVQENVELGKQIDELRQRARSGEGDFEWMNLD